MTTIQRIAELEARVAVLEKRVKENYTPRRVLERLLKTKGKINAKRKATSRA